jgi:23S rRNA (cytosine1962-C5)-methyltransferase
MERIRFRVPGVATPLPALLRLALPEADVADHEKLVTDGAVCVAGRPVGGFGRSLPAGTAVEIDCPGRWLAPEPRREGGRFLLLVPAPPWQRGQLDLTRVQGGGELHFEVREVRGGVAMLCVERAGASVLATTLLAALSDAGMPVLGDVRRGGVALRGGARIAADDRGVGGGAQPPQWPAEPAFVVPDGDPGEAPSWRISAATARALRRGHPWLLPDDDSDDPGRFLPGTWVRLSVDGSESPGRARIEGNGRIAARLVAGADRSAPQPVEAVEARVARALERRRHLIGRDGRDVKGGPKARTDAFRLVHGEADGLPGLAVDRLGSLLRVLVTGRACASWVEPVVDRIIASLGSDLGGDPAVLEVLHVPAPDRARVERVRTIRGDPTAASGAGSDPNGRIVVWERGLAYLVDPGLSEPMRARPGVGLYLDQRENRERVCRHARRGGRWLNLFAHTGAFSVALLAAGADEVVSVDLSASYLHWLEENLALNRDRGVDPARHRSVRRDGRRLLSELAQGDRFDGIVLDPPTAAAAGRRFWSVKRDLEPLLGEALARLASGGVLLACRNHRRARQPLGQLVARAADGARVKLAKQSDAGPGKDFPRLKGFPEGDSFNGVLVERA